MCWSFYQSFITIINLTEILFIIRWNKIHQWIAKCKALVPTPMRMNLKKTQRSHFVAIADRQSLAFFRSRFVIQGAESRVAMQSKRFSKFPMCAHDFFHSGWKLGQVFFHNENICNPELRTWSVYVTQAYIHIFVYNIFIMKHCWEVSIRDTIILAPKHTLFERERRVVFLLPRAV